MNKIVLFTQRVEIVESYKERRDCADQRIPSFIMECGYIPVPVPNNSNIAELFVKQSAPCGIVLTGGNSLAKYGGNAPERDASDRILLQAAVQRRIPVYGFCRGMQSILDFFGESLSDVEGHVAVRHRVSSAEESMEVNSYHNQGCMQLNTDNLEVLLKSDDGVIEKIKHKSLPIIGTMWHPEREDTYRANDIDMVKRLFGGAKQ